MYLKRYGLDEINICYLVNNSNHIVIEFSEFKIEGRSSSGMPNRLVIYLNLPMPNDTYSSMSRKKWNVKLNGSWYSLNNQGIGIRKDISKFDKDKPSIIKMMEFTFYVSKCSSEELSESILNGKLRDDKINSILE